jgi:hypothetical protein
VADCHLHRLTLHLHGHHHDGSKSLSLSEITPPGNKIIVGSVMDQDIGQNGIQSANIISGNEDDHFILRLKKSGGLLNLELETKHELDYETKSQYNLLIRVTDAPLRGPIFNLLTRKP